MRPPASVVVADAFLYWAHAAAAAIGVRTLAFFGANMFLHVMMEVLPRDNPAATLVGGGPDAVVGEVGHPDDQRRADAVEAVGPHDLAEVTARATAWRG